MKSRLAALAPVALVMLAGCKGGGGDIAALRDVIASGDQTKIERALDHSPACDSGGKRADDACLGRVATWLGSKTGFHFDPPDQASAATAAVVVLRSHGEQVPTPDAWLFTLREGDGPGSDALRVATSARMLEELKPVARVLASDDDAKALMRAVARSAAGACETYALVGTGVDDATLAPELSIDHSPCVQKDLDRATGPQEHGRYGVAKGPWRGAEGALALWKETAKALRDGASRAQGDAQTALASKLSAIDDGLAKVVTKKLEVVDPTAAMGDAHLDAGVPMVAPRRR